MREIAFRIGQQWHQLIDRLTPGVRIDPTGGTLKVRNSIFSEILRFMNSAEFKRTEERFFASFGREEEVRRILTSDFRRSAEATVEEAKSVLKNEIRIFGRKLLLGDSLSWHSDPLHLRISPRRFHADIDFLDFSLVGDHKIIWELNRHQHLLVLARAYWITGDQVYAQEWIRQIRNWIRSNPPKVGINWSSSLEIAYRSISWILGYLCFHRSGLVAGWERHEMLCILYLNGLHIERNLSLYFSPNTHLTGEALGLIYLGLFFHGTDYGSRWLRKGREILEDEIRVQVKRDGTYFERSAWYHRYTTEIYLHAWILMNRNGLPFTTEVGDGIGRLLDFLAATQLPDGRTPLFGDDDGGRVICLGRDAYDDFRSALSTGAVLFGREDYKKLSGGYSEETLWLLGPDSKRLYSALGACYPAAMSVSFSEGGYRVMRNGWGPLSDYMLIDCGPRRWGTGGHAHADLLNMTVSISGRECLIDPGTYTYSESPEWRNLFRISQAHNTAAADGQSQSLPGKPFSWLKTARLLDTRWCASEEIDYFSGKASICRYLDSQVEHSRDIVFLKQERAWIVRDWLRSDRERTWDLYFHFPSRFVEWIGNRFILSSEEGPYACLRFFAENGGTPLLKDDWRSGGYARKESAKTGVFRTRGKEACVITLIQAFPSHASWEHRQSPESDWLSCTSPERTARIEMRSERAAGDAAYAAAVHITSGQAIKSIYAQCLELNFFGKLEIGFDRSVVCAEAVQDKDGIRLRFTPDVRYRILHAGIEGVIDINGQAVRVEEEKCAASAE